ncbi:MAG: DUF2218 domain-containing protein [Caulobacteraceae bacterium]
MATSQAHVPTESASRYLQQLCKHWGHKYETSFDPKHGEISLPMGPCVMDAEPTELTVTLTTEDPAGLDRFETVVADHLRRFAFREELKFDWSRTA